MNQQETNKLIAEFMGYKLARCNNGLAWDIGKSLPSHKHLFPIQGVLHTGNELNFHSSWDWLMPVVEKIREKQMFSFINIYNQAMEEGCEIRVFDINNNNIFYTYPKVNTEEKTLLNVTHGAVVEFIKWYNQQKVSPDTM